MTVPVALHGRSVAALAVRFGIGVVLLVAAWIGASDELALDRQAPWVAVGVVGMIVAGASAALWLLQLRRAVSARVLAVVAAVTDLPEAGASSVVDEVRVRRHRGDAQLYHRPGCALVAGRAVDVGDASSWPACRPCEACHP